MISALCSPIWVCYQDCNLDFVSSYLVTSQKQKHFIPWRGRLSTHSCRGGLSAVILQDMDVKMKILSPCCCDLCHQKTPSPVLRLLLGLSQRCCPARCRGCALTQGSRESAGQHMQSQLRATGVTAAPSEAWCVCVSVCVHVCVYTTVNLWRSKVN